MGYNRQTGMWEGPSANTNGLDLGSFTTTETAPQWSNPSQGGGFSFGSTNEAPRLTRYGQKNTTYSGKGGNWTSTNGGSWTGANGETVDDLGGYLKSREALASGSDFSGYQAGLNTALNDQNDYSSRYKQLLDDPSKIQQTAGYQFDLDQGNQAINRSAAAKGMLGSGNVLAELLKYGQGMASKEYGNQLAALTNGSAMAGNKVNSLGTLMRGAQQFGATNGYFKKATNTKGQQPNTWTGG